MEYKTLLQLMNSENQRYTFM